jgi:hypothetical protein
MRSTFVRVGVVVVAALVLAGCGASSGTPPASSTSTTTTTVVSPTTLAPTTTSSVKADAGIYVAAAAKANAAAASFGTAADAWPASETGAQAEAAAGPLISAMKAFVTSLTDGAWPADATTDVHTLVSAAGAVIGDLDGLDAVTSLSGWVQQLAHDEGSLGTDADLVRHDLGLPPATAP